MDEIIKLEEIQNRIFTFRGIQVMIDRDLAELYGVETRVLNQAVKRNTKRFPKEFMFRLTSKELENWKSQIVISKTDSLTSQSVTLKSQRGKHRKYLPFAFTEQGVAMLSAVLRSETAVKVSVQIMQAFVKMRKFISQNETLFLRINNIEQKQISMDNKIDAIFDALEDKTIIPKQGIFYNGQIFDAYTLIAGIVRAANKSIILIDNYIDDTVFKQLAKRKKSVTAIIYSNSTNEILKQDLQKHNAQYPKIELKKIATVHDRFLIIDRKTVYHFGASLKDAGKKCFAFSKLNIEANDILIKL